MSDGKRRGPLHGKVVVVGPLPPPVFGPAVSTAMISRAFAAGGATPLAVNTQDRRSVFNTGVLDVRNAVLALMHTAELARRAIQPGVAAVYLPISQGRWGYVRDACLMAVARLCRRPLVVHLRGATLQDYYSSAPAIDRFLLRRTLRWVTLAIALTPRLRCMYDGLVPPDRVRVLENAIEDPWSQDGDRLREAREQRAEPGRLRILYVANDFATKGAETLIRAVAELRDVQAELRMIGAPPSDVAARSATLADELGVGDRVALLGEVVGEAKLRQLEWADTFAYPTENDGQPLVVLEAMAAGLAIVASTFGGVPDTVGDAALLVAPGDVAGLAAGLERLAGDVALRRELGRAARARYLTHYTPEPFQQRFEALFRDLLAEPA